jgi:hypothetical protein
MTAKFSHHQGLFQVSGKTHAAGGVIADGRAETGTQDDGDVRPYLMNLFRQRFSGQLWHGQIRNHQVESIRLLFKKCQ